MHYAEGHLTQNNLITSARDYIAMKKDLDHMFSPGEDGGLPFCFSSKYSRGYYQILQQQINSAAHYGELIIMPGTGKKGYCIPTTGYLFVSQTAQLVVSSNSCWGLAYRIGGWPISNQLISAYRIGGWWLAYILSCFLHPGPYYTGRMVLSQKD